MARHSGNTRRTNVRSQRPKAWDKRTANEMTYMDRLGLAYELKR